MSAAFDLFLMIVGVFLLGALIGYVTRNMNLPDD